MIMNPLWWNPVTIKIQMYWKEKNPHGRKGSSVFYQFYVRHCGNRENKNTTFLCQSKIYPFTTWHCLWRLWSICLAVLWCLLVSNCPTYITYLNTAFISSKQGSKRPRPTWTHSNPIKLGIPSSVWSTFLISWYTIAVKRPCDSRDVAQLTHCLLSMHGGLVLNLPQVNWPRWHRSVISNLGGGDR